jgi:DNA-binding transcriptional MerR regulator
MAPTPFDDENTPLYTVGQVAELLAVKQAFLRRVDDLQVVSPQRTRGGQRRYTRYEIRIIQQVVSMADEGITLQAIRRIIELEGQLAAMTRERDELARRLAELLSSLPGRSFVSLRPYKGRNWRTILREPILRRFVSL